MKRRIFLNPDWPPGSNERLLKTQVRASTGFTVTRAAPAGPSQPVLPVRHAAEPLIPVVAFEVPVRQVRRRRHRGVPLSREEVG